MMARSRNGEDNPADVPELPLHLLRPTIRSVPFAANLVGLHRLSRPDREHLRAISTVMRFKPRALLCERGKPAVSIFNIVVGAARSFRTLAPKGRRGLAFLFAGDLFGLGRKGVYVNTVQAITPVTLFSIPIEPLTALLLRDGDLQFRFLSKAAHALREAQRQAIVFGRRDPVDRLVIFLAILEEKAAEDANGKGWIPLPMTIQDIGEYVNLPSRTVRGAFHRLEQDSVLERRPDGSARVLNRRTFNKLLAGA